MNFKANAEEIKKEIKANPKLKIISIWGSLSFICVIAIKAIRGRHLHLSPTLEYLQGTLPNFFAATGITALAFLYYKLFFTSDNSLAKKLIFASLFAFFGLLLWEIIQYFLGDPMDFQDILMTAIGCCLTVAMIMLLKPYKKQ